MINRITPSIDLDVWTLTQSRFNESIQKQPTNKTMADKFMFIPNDEIQNYSFCRLQLVVKRSDT